MAGWQDNYLRLEIDEASHVVRQIRSGVEFPTIASLQASIAALLAEMQGLRRNEYALIQDMRAARGRNDPAFEAVMSKERPRMSQGFRRVAVLASTAIGRLQIQRYLDQDGIVGRAFLDEEEALRWLREA